MRHRQRVQKPLVRLFFAHRREVMQLLMWRRRRWWRSTGVIIAQAQQLDDLTSGIAAGHDETACPLLKHGTTRVERQRRRPRDGPRRTGWLAQQQH
jgi:hypothetical protein